MYNKEIIFPCFIHCCRETTDKFWKFIFEDLAYGKAPYGVYFSKDFMCCAFKGKEFSYKIDIYKPTNNLFIEVKKILQNKLGITSSKDLIKQKKNYEIINNKNSLTNCNDWSEIKKKEIKNILLEKFIYNYAEKNNLNKSQTKKLLYSIFISLQFKFITSNNIIIKNGIITKIEKIEEIKKLNFKNWNL